MAVVETWDQHIPEGRPIFPRVASLTLNLSWQNQSSINQIDNLKFHEIKQIACRGPRSGIALANEIIEEERNERIMINGLCARSVGACARIQECAHVRVRVWRPKTT